MDYWLVLAAVLFVAVAFIVFKLVKKALQAAMIVVSLAFVAGIACSAVVFVDAIHFKRDFGNSSKVFLLESGNEVVSGIYAGNEIMPVAQQDLRNYSDYLAAGDYELALGDDYKLIIISDRVLDDLGSLKIDDQSYPVQAVRDVFASTDEAAKQRFFVFVVKETFGSPLFFFQQYKKGNIAVYPETPMFKFIKIMPAGFMKSVGEKAFEKIKSAAERD